MIKAIETKYKGYRFRSRLEARWAVFFDALGVKWDYEPEGFHLKSSNCQSEKGYYLPDFFIHGNDFRGPYIEIKGQPPSDQELGKLVHLCEAVGAYGLLIHGHPGCANVFVFHKEGIYEGCETDFTAFSDYRKLNIAISEDDYKRAVEAALSARFEHGETPSIEGVR